jgi:hypothetical protein
LTNLAAYFAGSLLSGSLKVFAPHGIFCTSCPIPSRLIWLRVKGTVNGVATIYVGSHYEVQGTTTRKYYFAGTQRIAVRENSTLYFFLSDHLGSTAITVEEDGDFHGELRYSAWGETREDIGDTPTSRRFTGQAEKITMPTGICARARGLAGPTT